MNRDHFVKLSFGFLCLYILALPLSMAGMEIFGTLTALVGLGFLVSRKEAPIRLVNPDRWIWFFWTVIILGALLLPDLSINERRSIMGEGRWILISYGLILILNFHKHRLQNLMEYLFMVCGLVAIFAIYQAFTGVDPFRPEPYNQIIEGGSGVMWRAKGLFRSTMTYSYSIGMVACFMVPYFFMVGLKRSAIVKWAVGASTLLVLVSLLLTFTRGLWLSMLIVSVLMALRYQRRLGVVVASGLMLFSLAGYFGSEKIQRKVDSIVSLKNASNFQRFDLWHANWEMFKDYPLLGVGFSRTDERVEEYYEITQPTNRFVGHSHNNFMQVLAGNGALGMIFYLMMMWGFLRTSFGNVHTDNGFRNALLLGGFGAQIIFHLGGMTESTFIDNETWHMFMFLFMCLKIGKDHVDS